ncbi:MAG: hypothetical protein LBL71_00605 [Endomicrobium sp.]|nr:hypothetical protein [Endomicrobium sp.]
MIRQQIISVMNRVWLECVCSLVTKMNSGIYTQNLPIDVGVTETGDVCLI